MLEIGQGFKIEKGIPLPVQPDWLSRSGRPPILDWSKLEVGDSVLVLTQSAARTAFNYAYANKRHFTVRKQADGSGWRVWRIS